MPNNLYLKVNYILIKRQLDENKKYFENILIYEIN